MAIDENVIILEDEGFDIHGEGLDSQEHVSSLKEFLQSDKYKKINSLPNFDKCFEDNGYDIMGCVQELSDMADAESGTLIVLM